VFERNPSMPTKAAAIVACWPRTAEQSAVGTVQSPWTWLKVVL
jgi:hypothetical protein